MKNTALLAMMAIVMFSCSNQNAQKEVSKPDAAESTAKVDLESVKSASLSTKQIILNYLSLKNALTQDDAKSAAAAGTTLLASFGQVETTAIEEDLKQRYAAIAANVKQMAEAIEKNAGNIDQQRASFIVLSQNIADLVNTFGSEQKLFQDYCPMANDGKGALWISETEAIKNPYFGSSMLGCGTVKKTY